MSTGNTGDLNGWQDGYVLWNNRLLESFFSPASRGEEVWLQVDPDELDSIGRDLGGDQGFLKAVRAGPPWTTMWDGTKFVPSEASGDIATLVHNLVSQRNLPARRPPGYIDPGAFSALYAGRNAPTYLPHLAALVRSAATAGDAGFYADLRAALDLPDGWGTLQLTKMEVAWSDLQAWTREASGALGNFTFRTLGGHSRIGVPRSQSIMSRRDKENLPRLFVQCGVGRNQKFSPRLVADIKQGVSDSNAFSSQFRGAVLAPAFSELVAERLRSAFEEWDGNVPSLGGSRAGEAVCPANASQDDEVELCLSLSEGNAYPWLIHWRVPAIAESGSVTLENEGMLWEAPILGSEPSSTMRDESAATQAAAFRILANSAEEPVRFVATRSTSDGGREGHRELWLPSALLRVLVWRFDPVHRRHELRESALPGNGQAYLLATKPNAKRLLDFLAREGLGCKSMETPGLPSGWVLECLLDCSQLTDEQRNTLPDGNVGRPIPRMVRFVGGRFVSRGNMRQYMAYDLPCVELDAPAGAELRSEGLTFMEEDQCETRGSAIRRFQVDQDSAGPRRYRISVFHRGEELRGPSLRVAPTTGEGNYTNGTGFSLDPRGWPSRTEGGLRGVLRVEGTRDSRVEMQSFARRAGDFGQVITPLGVERIQASVPAMFLDTLAQKESMAYGPARDQLARLLARAERWTDTNKILHDLRGRGHLEIEVDSEGHMARVYSVAPGLYELTASNVGVPTYGVLGTLRLQQWASLLEASGTGAIYSLLAQGSVLEGWRLLPPDRETIAAIAEECGFELHDRPALHIAEWASSICDVRTAIEQLSQECPPGDAQSSEVFAAASASFSALQGRARVADGLECQLFRMRDINAERLKVYALGTVGPGGRRFGYVRDSAWGKWMALGAFAKFVKENYAIGDASPWPIPYAELDGTIWLPAHLKLPFVLERALTLCSGATALFIKVEGARGDGRIELARQPSGEVLGRISMAYEHMAKGKFWLGFQWVPPEVAREVARKLGGELAPM